MHVLIIDDEASIRKTTRIALEACGHSVVEAGSTVRAIRVLGELEFDVIFLDLKLGSDDGLELLSRILTMRPNQVVVMFTAYANVSTAVKAIKQGAFDFIPKPFTPQAIRDVLDRIHISGKINQHEDSLIPTDQLIQPPTVLDSAEVLVERALSLALKAAPTLVHILIRGNPGTGKRSLALEIHKRSAQRSASFTEISGGKMTRELLARITQGTLYVPEIADLDLEMQGHFLHWLDEIRSACYKESAHTLRLITSCKINLEERVVKGLFREDLLYRLNVVAIDLPDLALRQADLQRHIELTTSFYCKRLGKPLLCISPSLISRLQHYTWPNNFKEFNHVIESAVIAAGGLVIEVSDLPSDWDQKQSALNHAHKPSDLHELEAEHISRVLKDSRNLDDAAHKLGIDPSTLYRKRQKLGLI